MQTQGRHLKVSSRFGLCSVFTLGCVWFRGLSEGRSGSFLPSDPGPLKVSSCYLAKRMARQMNFRGGHIGPYYSFVSIIVLIEKQVTTPKFKL